MVKIKNPVRQLMVPLAVGSVMIIPGCNKENKEEPAPPSKTDLLVGDWIVTEWDGTDYTQYDYSILFKFQSNGDWQFCYGYVSDPTQNECYDGVWQWNDAETTITMNLDLTPTIDFKLDVTLLDENNLQGNWSYGSYDPVVIKFVKVN